MVRSKRRDSRRARLAAFLLSAASILVAGLSPAGPALATGRDEARLCVEMVNARQDLTQAIEHCTRAIGSRVFKGHNLSPLYYNRAWAYDELGNPDLAMADYDAAITIQPDYLRAYVARGYLHMTQGDKEAAIADFSRVLSADPDVFSARFNRGLAYEQSGRLDEARADYEKALELRPDDERVKAILKRLQIERE